MTGISPDKMPKVGNARLSNTEVQEALSLENLRMEAEKQASAEEKMDVEDSADTENDSAASSEEEVTAEKTPAASSDGIMEIPPTGSEAEQPAAVATEATSTETEGFKKHQKKKKKQKTVPQRSSLEMDLAKLGYVSTLEDLTKPWTDVKVEKYNMRVGNLIWGGKDEQKFKEELIKKCLPWEKLPSDWINSTVKAELSYEGQHYIGDTSPTRPIEIKVETMIKIMVKPRDGYLPSMIFLALEMHGRPLPKGRLTDDLDDMHPVRAANTEEVAYLWAKRVVRGETYPVPITKAQLSQGTVEVALDFNPWFASGPALLTGRALQCTLVVATNANLNEASWKCAPRIHIRVNMTPMMSDPQINLCHIILALDRRAQTFWIGFSSEEAKKRIEVRFKLN